MNSSLLIIPRNRPPKHPDQCRRELAVMSLEISCALANEPHLLDDLDEADQQRWRRLAAITADLSLSDSAIVTLLLPADRQALTALVNSFDDGDRAVAIVNTSRSLTSIEGYGS